MEKLRGTSVEETKLLIPSGAIISAYRGSIAHGMFVPSTEPTSIDDKDIMSVCVAPLSYYFGLDNGKWGTRGVQEAKLREWDAVSYELRKFVGLLVKSNPNVLALLWNEDRYFINVTTLGKDLIANREMFSSKAIYHSFTGYAHGQLHRMSHMAFEGYMGEKRKALVEKNGYDTKNAAHCVRLLRMGIEFLVEHKLYVDRGSKDATELLAIKRGEWTLERVKAHAEELFKEARAAYMASTLPPQPDVAKINDWLTDRLWAYHEGMVM